MWSQSAAISRRGHVRPDEIELVLETVEGTMADEDEHKVIVGLGLAAQPASASRKLRRGGLCAGERGDVGSWASALKMRSRSLAAAVKRCS